MADYLEDAEYLEWAMKQQQEGEAIATAQWLARGRKMEVLLREARDYIADEMAGTYADDLEFAAKIDAALGDVCDECDRPSPIPLVYVRPGFGLCPHCKQRWDATHKIAEGQ